MKKKILGAFIITVVIFSGCSNKSAVNNDKKDKSNTTVNAVSTDAKATNNEGKSAGNNDVKAVNNEVKTANTDVKPIKPGTIPKLSTKQKSQINSNVNSTLQNIDDALKSIETPNDINVE